jgi:hypothetical protein
MALENQATTMRRLGSKPTTSAPRQGLAPNRAVHRSHSGRPQGGRRDAKWLLRWSCQLLPEIDGMAMPARIEDYARESG